MSGYFKYFFTFSTFILILSLVLHEYYPHILIPLMQIPSIKYLTQLTHKILRNSLSIFDWEIDKNQEIKINKNLKDKKEVLFTAEELKNYDGKPGSKGLYLALLGLIFDVEKGKHFYGPDGGYGFFSGRDGSRAFVSGDFTEEGLIDDISGLTTQDYIGFDEWIQFYKKDYKYVGKLIGRYYNEDGSDTEYNHKVKKWIQESYNVKKQEKEDKKKFPPCNSEWTRETGSRVYCTKKSGGIQRDWVGVPRKVIQPGKTTPRCACVKNFGPPSTGSSTDLNRGDLDHPHLREFEGCPPDAESCKVIEDKKVV